MGRCTYISDLCLQLTANSGQSEWMEMNTDPGRAVRERGQADCGKLCRYLPYVGIFLCFCESSGIKLLHISSFVIFKHVDFLADHNDVDLEAVSLCPLCQYDTMFCPSVICNICVLAKWYILLKNSSKKQRGLPDCYTVVLTRTP